MAVPRTAEAQAPLATFRLVWVQPPAEADLPPPCARRFLIDFPMTWLSGDAAVVILAHGDDTLAAHRPLTDALLRQGAAVLLFPSGPAEGCADRPASEVAEVLGALLSLRIAVGAGPVVAIGLDGAGTAALAAAQEEVAARYLGPSGPRLVAGVAVAGGSAVAFAVGARPAPAKRWEIRMPLLCEIPAGPAPGAPWQACRRALLPAALPPRRAPSP